MKFKATYRAQATVETTVTIEADTQDQAEELAFQLVDDKAVVWQKPEVDYTQVELVKIGKVKK